MKTKIAFTLIELLVVIAIIAIIAAILFPVFAKVREKARQTACTSNEKQIGLALMQYVEDYDETLPNRQNKGGTNWKLYIQPYIKSTGVWVCPSNPNRSPSDDDGVPIPPDYAANNASGTPVDQPFVDIGTAPPVALATLQQPASTIGVVEFTGGYSNYDVTVPCGWWGCWNSSGSILFAGHTGVSNFLFMDGHVKSMRPLATLDQQDGGAASTNMWTNDGASFTSLGATGGWATGYTNLQSAATDPDFN